MKKYMILLFVMLGLSACNTTSSNDNTKIEMPRAAAEYCGYEYTVDELTEYFEKLGFTNISCISCNAYKSKDIIIEICIEKNLFSTEPWEAGEKYESDAEIIISYNETPMLTIDTCKEFANILKSADMDYLAFAEKYDGRYVEFNGYVHSHLTYWGETGHVIDVAGGDAPAEGTLGIVIRIGDKSWEHNIDTSVEEGELVFVSGKIDYSQSKYYKQLYVEGLELQKR